ncbi:sulfotransferase [Ekhidna sp.]|uniref:sulfotransferase n=1 Tax=Ekhidna sp. TaxID=2608089 RepID=UPI003C7A31E6
MKDKDRQKDHKRNKSLENVLNELESLLKSTNQKIVASGQKPHLPIIFIMGCARSGTTLLYQFLAKTGLFGYPNNIISRFYYSPYLGTRIYQMLHELDDKDEIFPLKETEDFSSKLGKTRGPNQPHEFWYFWNRFFQFDENGRLLDKSKKLKNLDIFIKELGTFQNAFNKPLILKALNMNWHIPLLNDLSENFYFLHLKRDIRYNAQSLLKARESFFGNTSYWYSFKPPNYKELKLLPDWKQVVEQVRSNNNGITEGLSKIPQNKQMTIHFEEFVENPNLILKKMKTLNIINECPEIECRFNKQDKITVDKKTWGLISNYVSSNF